MNLFLLPYRASGDRAARDYNPLTSDHIALANLSVDGSSTNYNGVLSSLPAETTDTDTFHDTSSNSGRLTIPSSLDGRYGIIHACLEFGSGVAAATRHGLQILKNGSASYDGAGSYVTLGSGNTFIYNRVRTQPILLSTNDYFEVSVYSSDTAMVLSAAGTSLSIEIVG